MTVNVIPIEYNELADEVRKELLPEISGIQDERLKEKLEILMEAFLDLREKPYHWSKQDFSILLQDFPIDTYQQFSLAMSKIRLPIGFVLSHLMKLDKNETDFEFSAKDLIELMDNEPKISINHFKILQVDARDLEETEEKIIFNHIDELIFSDDINPKLFRRKVSGINHCYHVEVPEQISKLLLLAKTRFVKEVTIREN